MPQSTLYASAPYGALVLRLTLAVFWMIHWWFKVGHTGMPATEAFFVKLGLPGWLAWFDIIVEVFFALALVAGIYVRLVCIVSLPILLSSIWIYRANGFYFPTGGIELPLLWAIVQVCLAMIGPGAWAMRAPDWLQRRTPAWIRVAEG